MKAIKDLFWTMAGGMVLMWLVCGAHVGLFGGPFDAPVWLMAVEVGSFVLLMACIEVGKQARQERREFRLELAKHMLTLQHGKPEPPRDDTRLPPSMLKAFQKDGQPCAKD